MIRVIKNIVLFLLVFGVTIFALDRFILYSEINPVSFYEFDNKVGRVFRPGVEYLHLTEGLSIGSTNEERYLGPGYGKDKDPDVLRIALLGDSYVEGFQLFDRHHMRSTLEKQLKEKYNINAQVMNFGRSGYDLADMYCYNANFVSGFKPDIVMYFLSNEDLTNKETEPGMPYPYIENDSLKIYYYIGPEGSSSLLSLNRWSAVSPLVQIIRNCINLYKNGETTRKLFGNYYMMLGFSETDPTVPSYYTDPPGIVQQKILKTFSTMPETFIVNRDKREISPAARSIMDSAGLKFIDLNDTLKSMGVNPYLWKYNKKEGHWNHSAHNAIGLYLADKIAAMYKKP